MQSLPAIRHSFPSREHSLAECTLPVGEALADLVHLSALRKRCASPQPRLHHFSTDCHGSPQSPSCYYETTALADAFGSASPVALHDVRGMQRGQQRTAAHWTQRPLPSASQLGTYATVRGHAAQQGACLRAHCEGMAQSRTLPQRELSAAAGLQPRAQGCVDWSVHLRARGQHAGVHAAAGARAAQVTTGYAVHDYAPARYTGPGGHAQRVALKRPAPECAARPPLPPRKLARSEAHTLADVCVAARSDGSAAAQWAEARAARQWPSQQHDYAPTQHTPRFHATVAVAPLQSSDAHSVCCAHAGTALRLPACALEASWPNVDFESPASSDATEEVDSASVRQHRQLRSVAGGGVRTHGLFAAPQSRCAATVQEMLMRERRELISLLWQLSEAGPSLPAASACFSATQAVHCGEGHVLEGFGESDSM